MILGFIGTGKISSSIIYGIFNSKLKVNKIYISSRNRNIAKKLAKKFREVKILKNNQEIIDKSPTIILAFLIRYGYLTKEIAIEMIRTKLIDSFKPTLEYNNSIEIFIKQLKN